MIYEATELKVPFKAEDMDGLYKKVCRGKYTDIDKNMYSPQLSQFIKALLQVAPHNRPSCDQILSMPFVHSMMVKLGFASPSSVPYMPISYNNEDSKF
jgi:NIMA (never in mitosis gene a)-related kinase